MREREERNTSRLISLYTGKLHFRKCTNKIKQYIQPSQTLTTLTPKGNAIPNIFPLEQPLSYLKYSRSTINSQTGKQNKLTPPSASINKFYTAMKFCEFKKFQQVKRKSNECESYLHTS